jgi:hypothetical protein
MLFFFAAAATWFAVAAADLVPHHVVPRFKPLTLPIHPLSKNTLHTRDVVGANGQQGNGLSAVGMSSDRQCVASSCRCRVWLTTVQVALHRAEGRRDELSGCTGYGVLGFVDCFVGVCNRTMHPGSSVPSCLPESNLHRRRGKPDSVQCRLCGWIQCVVRSRSFRRPALLMMRLQLRRGLWRGRQSRWRT